MIAVVLIWTVGFFFASLFQCWPIWVNWTGFGGDEENCVNTNGFYLAQAWSDVLTDCKRCLTRRLLSSNNGTVIILTLPLPCVGSLSSLISMPANSNPDLGNATARKAQGCRERHVPSRRPVSHGVSS